MNEETARYKRAQAPEDRKICELLAKEIDSAPPEAESKVWHAHPFWFLNGSPIVGYSKLKDSVRLLFSSGQSLFSPGLEPDGKFKAAEARFATAGQVSVESLRGRLSESRDIQWDYKNNVRRKSKLERLK